MTLPEKLLTLRKRSGLFQEALTEKLDNVEVLWITTDGTQYKTPGLELL